MPRTIVGHFTPISAYSENGLVIHDQWKGICRVHWKSYPAIYRLHNQFAFTLFAPSGQMIKNQRYKFVYRGVRVRANVEA